VRDPEIGRVIQKIEKGKTQTAEPTNVDGWSAVDGRGDLFLALLLVVKPVTKLAVTHAGKKEKSSARFSSVYQIRFPVFTFFFGNCLPFVTLVAPKNVLHLMKGFI